MGKNRAIKVGFDRTKRKEIRTIPRVKRLKFVAIDLKFARAAALPISSDKLEKMRSNEMDSTIN